MTPEEFSEMVRRTIDEAWNKGNLDAIDEMYASHCSFHDPSFPINGIDGQKEQIAALRAANPDLHFDVHDSIYDGTFAASRWTCGGTSTGEFRGLPATGKSWVMSGMTFARVEDDRVVEEWVNYDLMGALQQAGVLPEMAPQAETA